MGVVFIMFSYTSKVILEYSIYAAEAIVGYLLGSVSFSVILTKRFFNKDVRSEGSGNAGATNVARVFGFLPGIATLLLDMLKLTVPMLLAFYFSGTVGVTVAGIAGVLGHCFPIFFGFRGGKGVSVAVTVALFIDWRVVLISFAVFVIAMAISKIVSLSSCLGATSLGVTTVIFCANSPEKIILAVTTAVLIIFMHRSNIKRIIKGEEKKFSFKKKE